MLTWIRKELGFRKMEKAFKRGDLQQAHKEVAALLHTLQSDPDVLLQQAWLFIEEGKLNEAVNVIESYADWEGHALWLMLRGECAQAMKDYELAKSLLTRSLELSPDNLRAEYHLGLSAIALGDFDAAERWFENTLKYNPTKVQSRLLVIAEAQLMKLKREINP